MKKIYVFPRYSGDENSDWYQHAKRELGFKDQHINFIPLSFPNWNKPTIKEFLAFIVQAIPEKDLNQNTYFIGHSIGCRAAMIFLNEIHKKNSSFKIGGLLCVAGWWTVDKPWPQLKKWTDTALDFKGLQHICSNNIVVLLSDNDPFTSNTMENKNLWEKNLNAKVVIVPNAKHFNENEGFVEIINEISAFTLKLYFL